MEITGQTEMFVKMELLKKNKKVHALVAKNAGDEVLLDLDILIDWTILPPSFPQPMDKNKRKSKKKAKKVTVKNSKVKPVEISEQKGSVRTKMKFNEQQEENYYVVNRWKN